MSVTSIVATNVAISPGTIADIVDYFRLWLEGDCVGGFELQFWILGLWFEGMIVDEIFRV